MQFDPEGHYHAAPCQNPNFLPLPGAPKNQVAHNSVNMPKCIYEIARKVALSALYKWTG